VGADALEDLATGNGNLAGGYYAGGNLTGSRCIFLGSFSGYRQVAVDDMLLVDSRNAFRADAATELTHSILYGTMAATPEDQQLTINAGLHIDATRIIDTDSPYTIDLGDVNLYCDTDGGAITVNLQAGVEGRRLRIVNCGTGGNDVTITPNGAETVRGDAGQTLADGEILILVYNATEGWY